MARKKQLDFVDLTKPLTGLKKIPVDIRETKAPSFKIEDVPFINNDEKFNDIKKNIYELEPGKCLTINNEGTGFKMSEVKKKVSSIAFNHKKKFVEKDFSMKQINSVTLRIWRIK